jgi:aryl-alcohol dehydrogenase-like predicted oxidoreductase
VTAAIVGARRPGQFADHVAAAELRLSTADLAAIV